MRLIEYRSSAGVAVAPEIGTIDWRARGTKTFSNETLKESNLINLQTGHLKQLTIGVASEDNPDIDSTYSLEMILKSDAPKTYRQYVFRREGTFSNISGIENGLDKKALRFTAYGTSPDMVEVFINGVKRERGIDAEDYQIRDSAESQITPNMIIFNNAVGGAGISQIDIIISKPEPTTKMSISFKRNKPDESRLALGAFENISHVDRFINGDWKRYYLFTVDIDNIVMPLNSILVPSSESDVIFLLAKKPYTRYDRYSDVVLPMQDMSIERDYIKFYVEDKNTTVRATDTSLLNIFPPLRFGKFNMEKTIKSANKGVDEQFLVSSNMIVGPKI